MPLCMRPGKKACHKPAYNHRNCCTRPAHEKIYVKVDASWGHSRQQGKTGRDCANAAAGAVKHSAYIMTGDETWFYCSHGTPIMFGHGWDEVIPRVSQAISSKKGRLQYFLLALNCRSLYIYLRAGNTVRGTSSMRYLKGLTKNAITALDIGYQRWRKFIWTIH
jgi:hypothetical protein